jgi:hypothetical protein
VTSGFAKIDSPSLYSSAHFGESLAKVMKKMLLISQVAVLAKEIEGLGCHGHDNFGRLEAFGWKRKPSWYSLLEDDTDDDDTLEFA